MARGLYSGKTHPLEKLLQRLRPADRDAPTLVQLAGMQVQGYRRIQK
jgi:hypothetical protein